jgi:hypothetical protein
MTRLLAPVGTAPAQAADPDYRHALSGPPMSMRLVDAAELHRRSDPRAGARGYGRRGLRTRGARPRRSTEKSSPSLALAQIRDLIAAASAADGEIDNVIDKIRPLARQSLWVPRTVSPYAACAYSWMSPPSRSRRRTRAVSLGGGGWGCGLGGCWAREWCGRCVL